MPKQTRYYSATVHGHTVHYAASVAAAKQQAAAEIERHVASECQVARVYGRAVACFTHSLEWRCFRWCVVIPGEEDNRPGYWHDADTLAAAERAARYHAASCQWQLEDGVAPPAYMTDPNEQADWRRYRQQTLDYFRLRALGMSDYDAQGHANGNPAYRAPAGAPPATVPFSPDLLPLLRKGQDIFAGRLPAEPQRVIDYQHAA
jgi:hypothetical protein